MRCRRTTPQALLALLVVAVGWLGLTLAWPRETATGRQPAARAGAAAPGQEDLVCHTAQTYCTVGKHRLQLDVARPKQGKGPFPAIVVLHGTGPYSKGKVNTFPVAKELARRGYVGVAVDYRFRDGHVFPCAIEDVKSAVRWVRANAGKYDIDPERIGVLGYSAGGGLACLLGMAGPKDGLEGNGGNLKVSSKVRAVVAYSPPTDLTRLYQECTDPKGKVLVLVREWMRTSLERWLGGTPKHAAAAYAKASPVTYVRKDISPLLLIHGTSDTIVPFEQSQALVERLRAVRGRAHLLALANAGHDIEDGNDANARLAELLMLGFLNEHLKGGTAKR
jgi:acetyl esterase/lipase